ncbi:MAG: inter-alpha-trypsin inhibitor heavy chain H2 [precursor] [Planctomycetaceae bacterium]|nr:MAG: inter-alpha-trypsin inhibitor heavy chain H2 [precursor] [Planctomycetaceae bacterium]
MSWLAPWYLVGLVTVLGPVVFHLWRRTPRGRRFFSSLRFLEPSPPTITRRSRLEHWWLFVLRVCACVLVTLAFARPVWRSTWLQAEPAPRGTAVAILIDRSASMRRQGIWEHVQREVASRLESWGDETYLALFAYDESWEVLVPFPTNSESSTPSEGLDDETPERSAIALQRARLRAALEQLQPGWRSADLGHALLSTAQVLQAEQSSQRLPPSGRIVLVTDLASGSRLEALQTADWPREIAVEWVPVMPEGSTQAGLHVMGATLDPTDQTVRLRVTNAASSARSDFTLLVRGADHAQLVSRTDTAGPDTEPLTRIHVHVPPGQQRVVPLTGDVSVQARRVELVGDDDPFDNHVWLADPVPMLCAVLYLGEELSDDPQTTRFYWERALTGHAHYHVQFVTLDSMPHTMPPLTLATSVPAQDTWLRRILEAGGTVVWAPTSAGQTASLLAACDWSELQVEDARPTHDLAWSEIDFEHPWLAPFAEARFADFSTVRFHQYRRLKTSLPAAAEVLLRFENGDPAVVLLPAKNGRGRIWWFLSSWAPSDSLWARSTRFAPLMWRLLELATGETPRSNVPIVGQPLRLPQEASRWSIITPTGEVHDAWLGSQPFPHTTQPGWYVCRHDQVVRHLAVNVAPEESAVEPLAAETLENLGVVWSSSVPPSSPREHGLRLRQQQLQELELRQRLWHSLLMLAGALVLGETILATWIRRRRMTTAAAATQHAAVIPMDVVSPPVKNKVESS